MFPWSSSRVYVPYVLCVCESCGPARGFDGGFGDFCCLIIRSFPCFKEALKRHFFLLISAKHSLRTYQSIKKKKMVRKRSEIKTPVSAALVQFGTCLEPGLCILQLQRDQSLFKASMLYIKPITIIFSFPFLLFALITPKHKFTGA